MTETAPKSKLTEITIVYCGHRYTTEGKLAALIVPLAVAEKATNVTRVLERASVFAWKERELPRVVGGIYVVDGEIDEATETVNRCIPAYRMAAVGLGARFNNAEIVASLEARDKALRVERLAEKEQERLRKDTEMLAGMKPLRQRYSRLTPLGKLALEVVVLDALRRGE